MIFITQFMHRWQSRDGGYYSDFGDLEDIMKSLRDVFVYDGRYSKFGKI
ncbi:MULTISPECIES: hypothetical protein [Metallosphaera]